MARALAVIGVATLAGALAILGVDRFVDATTAQTAVLIGLNLFVLALGVALRADPRMPFLCDPIVLVCAFLFQFFVLAPIFMFIWGLQVFTVFFHPPAPETVALTLFAFLLMMALCLVGYRSRLGVMLAGLMPEFRPSRSKLPGRLIEVGLLVVFIATSFWWIQIQGGLLAKLATSYGASRINSALFNLSHKGLVAVTLLLAWRAISAAKPRSLDWWLLGVALTFDAVFFGILLGARKYLLFLFFGILTIWLLRRGIRTLPRIRTAVVLTVLLVFFSVWGAVRGRPVTALVGQEVDVAYAPTPELYMGYVRALTGPFSGACKVMEVYPEREPFYHGSSLAIFYLGFIPRAVWPDKPVGIGKAITRYYEGPYSESILGLSVAPTILGEFWVNFGWIGVVAGGFLLGILCRMVTAYAVTGMRDGLQLRAARVLIPAVIVAALGEVRADLAAMLITWSQLSIPILLALTFFRLEPLPATGEAGAWKLQARPARGGLAEAAAAPNPADVPSR